MIILLKIYRNCDRKRIRLLSLGTGDFVLDPLNPDATRNLLFWARNNQSVIKVLMDGPQNNIDLHLNSTLGDNYYRWQVWLEDPIELDDIADASINRLIDLAHGYLEEMEAYDNRQRLGRLDREPSISNFEDESVSPMMRIYVIFLIKINDNLFHYIFIILINI